MSTPEQPIERHPNGGAPAEPSPEPPGVAAPSKRGRQGGRQGSRKRGGNRWLLLVTAIATGLLVYLEAPREIARWYLAAALEKEQAEQLPQAIQLAGVSLQWDAKNVQVLITRALWLIRLQRYEEALADLNRALEFSPDSVDVLATRAEVYRKLDRKQECFADLARVVELDRARGPEATAVSLNMLAYLRALADVDLPEAFADADESVQILEKRITPGADTPWQRQLRHSLAAVLDTRGYLHIKLGRPAEGLEDLDRAISVIEEQSARLRAMKNRIGINQRLADSRIEALNQSLGTMYYHRALAHAALNREHHAQLDLEQARKLGIDAEKNKDEIVW